MFVMAFCLSLQVARTAGGIPCFLVTHYMYSYNAHSNEHHPLGGVKLASKLFACNLVVSSVMRIFSIVAGIVLDKLLLEE